MAHRFNSDEWFVWEQNASPMLLTMTVNPAFNELRQYLGSCLFNSVIVYEHDDADNYQARWLFRFDEGRIIGQKMLDMLLCPSYASSFNTGVQVTEERVVKKANELWKNREAYSLDDVIVVFEEFLQRYYDYYKLGWFTEPVQWHIEHLISGYMKKHYKGDIPLAEATKALFVTESESFTIGIIRSLYECAKAFDEILANDKSLQELVTLAQNDVDGQNRVVDYVFASGEATLDSLLEKLRDHSDKYHWKSNNYFATKFVSPRDVLSEMIEKSHFDNDGISNYYANMIATIVETKAKQLEVKAQIFGALPSHYRNLVGLSNSIGSVLIDNRKRTIMLSNSVFDSLLAIVAKATSSSLEDIHLLIPQELRSFIDDPTAYQERFEERRKLFVCVQTDFPVVEELIKGIDASSEESVLSWRVPAMTEPYIAEGIVAEETLSKLNQTMNLFGCEAERGNSLHGVVAFYDPSDAVVEGVVRVIRNPKSERLLDGEILVAPSTTPDYLSAINKCKAIITDWGSQTSHAAIVSRELKKSCIIGTNYASQLLKTGQKVRLDFGAGSIEVME